jgi:hypothetical protein
MLIENNIEDGIDFFHMEWPFTGVVPPLSGVYDRSP